MNQDDERDLRMHAATEAHIKALRITWGLSRKQALEHLVAFAENDEEAPVFCVTAAQPRRRRSRKLAEATA